MARDLPISSPPIPRSKIASAALKPWLRPTARRRRVSPGANRAGAATNRRLLRAAYMSNSEKASKAPAGLPARKAALAILSDVLRRKRPLDVAVDDALAAAKLEPRDAGFARAIATTSLRRFGQLEALLLSFLDKTPPPHKAGPTLEILTAGACELLFLGVAPHAAVDGANRLAQADAKAVHFKGPINAVLRRIAREGAEVLSRQDAARLNTSDWLWQRWQSTYGEETTRAIAHAHLAPAPLDILLIADEFAGLYVKRIFAYVSPTAARQ